MKKIRMAIRYSLFAIRYLRFAVRSSLSAICYSLLSILALFVLANWCFPLPKAQLHRPLSPIVLDRKAEWLRAFLAADGMWRFSSQKMGGESWVMSRELTQNPAPSTQHPAPLTDNYFLHQAILTSEDRWFYYHFGVNPVSIVTALYDNITVGKVVRGGSTITMQLARLMEPKARNVPNKLWEMFRALQLELAYSKSEILTFYFNMLPYGGNIVGTATAARFYFNKPQHAMSLGEAALPRRNSQLSRTPTSRQIPGKCKKGTRKSPEPTPCTPADFRAAVASGIARTDSDQTLPAPVQSTTPRTYVSYES